MYALVRCASEPAGQLGSSSRSNSITELPSSPPLAAVLDTDEEDSSSTMLESNSMHGNANDADATLSAAERSRLSPRSLEVRALTQHSIDL